MKQFLINISDQVEEIDNVYDVVDVDEYSELVSKRQNDDWIVDDDGGYVEDGREIFDEEMGDEVQGHRSSAGSKRNPTDKGNQKSRRKADANATTEEGSSSSAGKSIKNMILNMGGASKKSLKKEANLQDDLVLGELLGEFKSSSSSKPQDKKGTKIKAKIGGGGGHSNPFATQVVRPSSTGIKREAKRPKMEIKEEPSETALSQMIEDDDDFSQMDFDEPMIEPESQPTQKIEDSDDEPEVKVKVEEKENLHQNRGFKTVKKEEMTEVKSEMQPEGWTLKSEAEKVPEIKVDLGKLPLLKNDKGEKVLRMYWLDAFEDVYKHPGTVWLFGKVYVEAAKSYVSCCVTVKNIDRQVFLLARDERVDLRNGKPTGESVGMGDVYEEFNEKIATRFKITDFK